MIAGIIVAIVIIAFIFFFPCSKTAVGEISVSGPQSPVTVTCDPPSPVPVYGLLNDDRNLSHHFHITVNDSTNLTIGEESFALDPGEYIESEVKTSNKKSTPIYLTFIVDGNSSFYWKVNASTSIIQSFDYNPQRKEIVTAVLFHSDYGCNIPTPSG